jgi:hypothetical protein
MHGFCDGLVGQLIQTAYYMVPKRLQDMIANIAILWGNESKLTQNINASVLDAASGQVRHCEVECRKGLRQVQSIFPLTVHQEIRP